MLKLSRTERWGIYLIGSSIPAAGLDMVTGGGGGKSGPSVLQGMRDAIRNPPADAETMGELSLLGIHDVAFLVRSSHRAELDRLESVVAAMAGQITGLCKWRNSADRTPVVAAATAFRQRVLSEIIPQFPADRQQRVFDLVSEAKMPGEALLCPPRILNSSFDLLLPLVPPPQCPKDLFDPTREVACISFYRLQPRVLATNNSTGQPRTVAAYRKLEEAIAKPDVNPWLRVLFAGIGCYQVVAFFAGASLETISAAKDALSKALALRTPEQIALGRAKAKSRTLHLVDTSSTLFAVPSEAMAERPLERCDASILLKIWPGYREDETTYRYLGDLADACDIRATDVRCISETSCVLGERQGHFDAVLTIVRPGTLQPVLRLLDVLGLLVPFVEDTATILRFNSNT
ncbi:MAG: hypothetical protein GW880_16485 [Armatimonadetes bacterium]|nr:hypothetical protein [Armatimonadota bacterium]